MLRLITGTCLFKPNDHTGSKADTMPSESLAFALAMRSIRGIGGGLATSGKKKQTQMLSLLQAMFQMFFNVINMKIDIFPEDSLFLKSLVLITFKEY